MAAPTEEPENGLVEDEEPLRWYVLALYATVLVAGFAITVWCAVAWYGHCDDGRHVTPFTAGDSLRGSLCDAGGGVVTGLVLPAAWLLGLAVATVALVRGTRMLVLVLLVLTPALLPAAVYAALDRTPTKCSADDLAAYGEWADAGSKGAPPSDCRTF